MDLKSLSLGERIAAVSGAALFVFTFVAWLEGSNAWELFSLTDVLLSLLALIAVALPLVKAVGSEPPLRVSTGTVLARAGLVALTITAVFLIEARDRDPGIFLAVLASAGILYGGMSSSEPAGGGARRSRERPRRSYSSTDFEEPPPGMEDWRAGDRSWGDEGFEDESEERVPPRRGVEESDARGGSRPLDLDEDPGAQRSERATSEHAEASDPRRRPGGGTSGGV
ncbi:MAG TPA: hypothetical protein VE528_00230 [Thermoleophilaceae bacterium]|nr:hypothetical protein [Thermoleophilaceae bacterium]